MYSTVSVNSPKKASPPLASSNLQQNLERAAQTDNSSSDEARIRDLTTSMSRFSLGQLPRLSNYYAPSETSDQLLKLLKDQPSNQPNALIEVVGKAGAGKTTMLQHLIDQNQEFFASYKLFGRIDCSSVSRAHADIQAISYACSGKDLKPQAALWEVASYIQKNSPSLLILDGLSSGNVDFVFLDWLKSSFKSAQLVYLTTQNLADSLGEKLERPVKSLSLDIFTPEQAKQLVEKCLPREPKKSLEKIDFSKVIEMTEGFPAAITTLCQHYKSKQVMFNGFDDFLAQPNAHQNALDSSLNAVAQASLKSVEEDASPVAARALNIIKQAAWLVNYPIPYAFFVHEQQMDGEAIQMLHDKELAILDINRDSKTLKLNSTFLRAVQDHYKVEQRDVLKKNIQRLSEVFNYLTTNEGKNGSQSKPKDLTNYTDLVHTLLFETCKKESFAGDLDLLQQVLALGSSLARMYYMYHGESELAYKHLQNAEHFAKQGLSDERIEQFAQNPEKFKDQEIEPKEAALLRLYAQEYLYQSATIASQLDKRGEVPAEVVQNFEKSYAIQVNLGEEKDPESIAYTLRNYTRALRKQGHLLNTLEEFRKLRQLLDRYPEVFNERTCAELLIDEGIVQKEAEDARPEGEQKDYQAALNTLLETRRIYLKDDAAQGLGMLSIYLGDTYVAAGQFAEGITHTCRILHYDGKNKGRQARAYFNLAQAFDKAGYGALAKLFIERAAPLQLKTYKATTDRLQLNIDKKLLERHQKASSSSNAQTASWKTIEELTTYCETELLSGSKPSNNLSLAQIKAFDDEAYNWLQQRDVKEKHVAQQAELDKKEADLDAQDKVEAEKLATQSRQDKIWYRELANRIKLDELKNPLAHAFAKQFEENLRNEIVQQLRVAYGEAVKMGRAELVGGLVEALAGLLPEIQVDMTGEVSASIDIASVIQGVAKILTERKLREERAEAQRIHDSFSKLDRAKSMKALESLEEQIQEMANYTARCWQPVFSAYEWSKNDIQMLAKQGAQRMMEYLGAGKVDKLSSQERVVFALMAGEANKRLTQHKMKGSSRSSTKWSVQGFFTKPGIKVETDEQGKEPKYFLRDTSHPSVYGYRLGSPIEVRNSLHYKGPFTDEAKARQEAEKMRDDARCLVM